MKMLKQAINKIFQHLFPSPDTLNSSLIKLCLIWSLPSMQGLPGVSATGSKDHLPSVARTCTKQTKHNKHDIFWPLRKTKVILIICRQTELTQVWSLKPFWAQFSSISYGCIIKLLSSSALLSNIIVFQGLLCSASPATQKSYTSQTFL